MDWKQSINKLEDEHTISSAIHRLTSNSSEQATPNSCRSYEKMLNGFPRFAAVTNKEISQIIKQAVPEIHEGDEIRFGSFSR